MTKDKTNIIVAVVIILVAFLDIPTNLKNFVYVLGALIVLVPSLQDLRKAHKLKLENEVNDTFVESRPTTKKQEGSKIGHTHS